MKEAAKRKEEVIERERNEGRDSGARLKDAVSGIIICFQKELINSKSVFLPL